MVVHHAANNVHWFCPPSIPLDRQEAFLKTRLTNSNVEKLKPQAQRYEVWDSIFKGLHIRVSPSGDKVWYLHYRIDGKRNKYRIGRNLTVAQARDIAKEISGEVAKGIDINNQRKLLRNQANSHTLKSFIEKPYSEWRYANRKRVKDTIDRLKKHFYPLFKNTKLKDISAWNVEKWKTARLKSGIKPTTVNRDIAELKSVLSKAVEWGEIEEHPLKRVKPAKIDHNPNVRYLSKEEEKRLRKSLSNRDKRIKIKRASGNQWRKDRGYMPYPDLFTQTYADYLTPMVILSINTGLRRGEVFHLQWEDIDPSKNTLTVSGSKTKSGHTRHIPLNNEALTVLKNWGKHHNGLIFPNKHGEPLDNIKRAWGTLLKEANIDKFRWHDLRHHFASSLVMVGVDLNTVRELLGHSDIKTTLRYAHLAPEHKAEAVKRLDLR